MSTITRAFTQGNAWSDDTVNAGAPDSDTVDYTGVSFDYVQAYGNVLDVTSSPFTVKLQTSPDGSTWSDGPSVDINNDGERFTLTHTPTAGHDQFRLTRTNGEALVRQGTIVVVDEV